MSDTTRHIFPLLSVGQSAKEIDHNEALKMIDALMAGTADIQDNVPPTPADGLVVLIPASPAATGAFAGHETEIAYYFTSSAAWAFSVPIAGQEIFVVDEETSYRWTGSAWVAYSGTYTPTLTNVTNIDSSTAYACQWMRVGKIVTVSGRVNIDPTAAGATELGISLPVASNFALAEQAGGTAASDTVADGAMWIKADTANDRLSLNSVQSGTAAHDHYFHATYRIL